MQEALDAMRSQGSSLDHAFLKVDKSAHLPSRAVRAAGSCLLDRTSDELNLKDQRRNVTNSRGPLPIILHVVEIFPAGGQIDPHAHWRLFTVNLGICLQPNTAINCFFAFAAFLIVIHARESARQTVVMPCFTFSRSV